MGKSWLPSLRWTLLAVVLILVGCASFVALSAERSAVEVPLSHPTIQPPPPSLEGVATASSEGHTAVRTEPPEVLPPSSALPSPPPAVSGVEAAITTTTVTTTTVPSDAPVVATTTTANPAMAPPRPSLDLRNCTTEDGAPLSAPCDGGFDEVCISGLKCPQHCMAIDARLCLHNPYWPNEAATKYDETVCVNRAPASPKPSLPPLPPTADDDNSTTTAATASEVEDPVLAFKSRTAWAFDQWWDWNATCLPPRSEDDARYRAYLDEASREYVLDNVCIQGVGRLAGFNGTVSEKFDARDEVEWSIPPMLDFVNTIDALQKPPACFVDDVNLILSFQDLRVPNVAHAFHRFAQILLMQRFHFPKPDDPPHPDHPTPAPGPGPSSPRKPTVVGHVWLHDLFAPPHGNGLRYFLPMMGDAWFSVFGNEMHAQSAETLRRVGGREGLWRLGNTSLCFRRARIAHACIMPHCNGNRTETRPEEQFRDSPGRRYKISFTTPRTAYDTFVFDWIRQVVARCVGVVPKLSAETVNPSVVFTVRSRNRPFSQASVNAYHLLSYAQRKHNAASVIFSDVMTLKPNTFLRQHINLDVLIGAFGSGLTLVALMPRGASLMEMCGVDNGCPTLVGRGLDGFFRPAECEYAGLAAARGVRQFHHTMPAVVNRVYVVPPSRWQFVIDTAFCALRWEPETVFTLNATTLLMTTDVLRDAYRGLVRDCERAYDNSSTTPWPDASS